MSSVLQDIGHLAPLAGLVKEGLDTLARAEPFGFYAPPMMRSTLLTLPMAASVQ